MVPGQPPIFVDFKRQSDLTVVLVLLLTLRNIAHPSPESKGGWSPNQHTRPRIGGTEPSWYNKWAETKCKGGVDFGTEYRILLSRVE
jgi:hypothetical protein